MQHDCCTADTKKKKKAKGVDSFLIGIVLTTLVLLGGVVYFGAQMGATTEVLASTEVETQVDEMRHDWGTIDINGGIVSKTFTIENSGTEPLQLYDVQTSCMCTTAQLKTKDNSSKKFGMHEKTRSIFEVAPGETAELIIEFDPNFHGPSGVGPISRTVTISTNDANNPGLAFQLSANVIKQ